MQFRSKTTTLLADYLTPVSVYNLLNKKYSPCLLLESSDYHTKEDSYSIICCDELLNFERFTPDLNTPKELSSFIDSIEIIAADEIAKRFNSVFGFSTYEAVQSFETINFRTKKSLDIPQIKYQFFRFVLVFHHFSETLYLIENLPDDAISKSEEIIDLISEKPSFKYQFKRSGERQSNMTDDDFEKMVSKGKQHCQIGDVFQIVLSRKFIQAYEGDNFLVYRTLRSINPSPFAFYFNYGEYQIFGASPEAQILVRDSLAEIHPIAGTFKRTGDDEFDAKEAQRLAQDPKENSEHIMLVDLARNDLGKSAEEVTVARYREIQFYSHVIHMVSKVTGILPQEADSRRLYADTFPAGTLSGAPKFKAMELIDEYEPSARDIYGGAIGAFGLNGDVNHAIAIRTFLAKDNNLYYQAGAGVVIDSVEEKEREEVYHKLRALEQAMQKAEELS